VVSRDPDTGRRNGAFHRLQIKGARRTGILLLPRHTYQNYRTYEAKGEPMPIAIFIELEVAGSFLGEAVPPVRCETVDLEVPADAEIVLEGHVLPHVREAEGPFSEFQDYCVAGMGQNPVAEFHALTRRHDAIFKAAQNGSEVEGCVFHKIPMAATLYRRLRTIGGTSSTPRRSCGPSRRASIPPPTSRSSPGSVATPWIPRPPRSASRASRAGSGSAPRC
jgi:2,5-furandicarboxylate decarboxylase 1